MSKRLSSRKSSRNRVCESRVKSAVFKNSFSQPAEIHEFLGRNSPCPYNFENSVDPGRRKSAFNMRLGRLIPAGRLNRPGIFISNRRRSSRQYFPGRLIVCQVLPKRFNGPFRLPVPTWSDGASGLARCQRRGFRSFNALARNPRSLGPIFKSGKCRGHSNRDATC